MLLRSKRIVPQRRDSRSAKCTSKRVTFKEEITITDFVQIEEPRAVHFSKRSYCSISSSTVKQNRDATLPPFNHYDYMKPTARAPLRRTANHGQMFTHPPILPQERSLSTVHCSSPTHGKTGTASRGWQSSGPVHCSSPTHGQTSTARRRQQAEQPSSGPSMIGLLLIILIGLIGYFFLPLEMSFIPGRNFAVNITLFRCDRQPVANESAALATNHEHMLAERQLQKELDLSQHEERLKKTLQEVAAVMEAANSESKAAVDSLLPIIETLEAQQEKLLSKINSMKQTSSGGSSPEIGSAPKEKP